jgi:hypothetical protein
MPASLTDGAGGLRSRPSRRHRHALKARRGCARIPACTVGVWRSLVSALVWGTRGRQFKSGHADHRPSPVHQHLSLTRPAPHEARQRADYGHPVPPGDPPLPGLVGGQHRPRVASRLRGALPPPGHPAPIVTGVRRVRRLRRAGWGSRHRSTGRGRRGRGHRGRAWGGRRGRRSRLREGSWCDCSRQGCCTGVGSSHGLRRRGTG